MESNEFSHSADGEIFSGATFPTREEALAAGRAYAEPGCPVYTGRHEAPPRASAFMVDAHHILEMLSERAYEEHDEFAEDWPSITDRTQVAQIEAHLDAIAELVQSFDPPTFFRVIEIEKHLAPEG